MGKKYVGISYEFSDDNRYAKCIIVVKDFENIQKWFKGWAEDSGHEDDFSKENTNVDFSWEDNYFDYKLCIVDNWNNKEQVSKFRDVLKHWCEMAKICWERRIDDAYDCFGFLVFNNDTEIYNVLNDKDLIHDKDGEYKHDFFDDYSYQSVDYLLGIINNLVAEETKAEETKAEGTEVEETKAPTEAKKDFVDVIADKLLANAMDKVKAKIENCDNLFDDAIINSLVDKLFEKVSDRLNEKLGL